MSRPRVVVVVLNWNGREDTLACLESLRVCSYPDFGILVVDNGSTDGSQEAVESAYPDVPVLQTGANLGFAGGNNAGIEWALAHGAEYVLLLNNDTRVDPGFLDALVGRAEADPKVGIVGAAIAYATRPERLWAFGGGRFDIATACVRHIQEPVDDAALATRGSRHFYVTGCTMLLRREVLEEVGRLDTSYFHFCEDADLCLRAEAAGYRCVVAADARLVHKVSATTRVSSPVFLYYNLRSRLRLVQRFGPQGAPTRRALVLLWLRLWRPALLSGQPWTGWRALLRAWRDFRSGVEGPAPPEVGGPARTSQPRAVSTVLLLALLLLGAAGLGRPPVRGVLQRLLPSAAGLAQPAVAQARPRAQTQAQAKARAATGEKSQEAVRSRAEALEVAVQRWWGSIPGEPPADLAELLWRMAQDPAREARVLVRADTTSRRLTAALLDFARQSEREALEVIPDLHVVRDDSPPPGARPPAWSDIRRVALRLLTRVALDAKDARDRRLSGEVTAALRPGRRVRASDVGRILGLWEDWWTQRGLLPRYYVDPTRIPDVSRWLEDLRKPPGDPKARTLRDMLGPLAEDGLRRQALLRQLSADTDAHLVAECMELLPLYQVDFESMGFARRRWDPREGRVRGFRASQLRGVAMEVLARVTHHVASGLEEEDVLRDWLAWWRRARFEARYWRNPRDVPSLAPWLSGLDAPEAAGGKPMARILRDLYVASGFRELLLQEIGSDESGLVAELVDWLDKDARGARDAGFVFAFRAKPLRPLPGEKGPMVAIPWLQVRALIREMLRRITGDVGLPEEDVDEEIRNGFWRDWWQAHRHEVRWYRDGKVSRAGPEPPAFVPERSRLR